MKGANLIPVGVQLGSDGLPYAAPLGQLGKPSLASGFLEDMPADVVEGVTPDVLVDVADHLVEDPQSDVIEGVQLAKPVDLGDPLKLAPSLQPFIRRRWRP